MSDLKHLVFTERVSAFSRVYHIKDVVLDAPFLQAVPISIWQNSLDVFEASTGKKAFKVKSRNIFVSNYDVIDSGDHILGTVIRKGLFSNDWVISDAHSGVAATLCKTAIVISDGFGREYQIKIDDRIVCTLNEKRTLWNRSADLHFYPFVTESLNETLLISAVLLALAMCGDGGGGGM